MCASIDVDVVDGDVERHENLANVRLGEKDIGIADADLLLRDVDSLLIRRSREIPQRGALDPPAHLP